MPAQLSPVSYEPMKAVRVFNSQGAMPALTRFPEAALQTFKLGVPLMLNGGFLQEFSTSASNIVYGFSGEQAHNYATAGVPIDLNDPAAGPPPNQPAALVIPMGAAIRDGLIGNYLANGVTVFSGALKVGQIFSQSLVIPGTFYGIVKDATSGFWYVDTTITNGNAACVQLMSPYFDAPPSAPNDPVLGSRVFFQIAPARRFFS